MRSVNVNVLMQWFVHWKALPRSVRLITVVVATGIVALSIAATILMHPARTALFAASLHPEQLAEVEERLATWNVLFTPTADNVIVAAGRRNDLLLPPIACGRASSASLQHRRSVGRHRRSHAAIRGGRSDARGLAGDVEAGLRGIEGIDDARVIVARPNRQSLPTRPRRAPVPACACACVQERA